MKVKAPSFDEELAAVLGRIEFPEQDVKAAFNTELDDSIQVGTLPSQEEDRFQVYTVLAYVKGEYRLYVVVFDNDQEITDPRYTPEFKFALTTHEGRKLASIAEFAPDDSTTPYVVLNGPDDLIAAMLELSI
jgi:hypothetical protein